MIAIYFVIEHYSTMSQIIDQLKEFLMNLHPAVYAAFLFITTLPLILIPLYIAGLPHDHWVSQKRRSENFLLVILRNIAALSFFFIGVLLLFLPGQGLLFILLGASISAFPGKKKLVNFLVHKKSLQKSLNLIRKLFKNQPFIWPNHEKA